MRPLQTVARRRRCRGSWAGRGAWAGGEAGRRDGRVELGLGRLARAHFETLTTVAVSVGVFFLPTWSENTNGPRWLPLLAAVGGVASASAPAASAASLLKRRMTSVRAAP